MNRVILTFDKASCETLTRLIMGHRLYDPRIALLVDPSPDSLSELPPASSRIIIVYQLAVEWLCAVEARPDLDVWLAEPSFIALYKLSHAAQSFYGFFERLSGYLRERVPIGRRFDLLKFASDSRLMTAWGRYFFQGDDYPYDLSASTTEVLREFDGIAADYLTASAGVEPVLPRLRPGQKCVVSSHRLGACFLTQGWYGPEPSHTWTNGREATIHIPVESSPSVPLYCKLVARCVPVSLVVRVLLNGQEVMVYSLPDGPKPHVELVFPLGQLAAFGSPLIELCLRFSRSWSPSSADPALLDNRQLAFGLETLEIVTSHKISGNADRGSPDVQGLGAGLMYDIAQPGVINPQDLTEIRPNSTSNRLIYWIILDEPSASQVYQFLCGSMERNSSDNIAIFSSYELDLSVANALGVSHVDFTGTLSIYRLASQKIMNHLSFLNTPLINIFAKNPSSVLAFLVQYKNLAHNARCYQDVCIMSDLQALTESEKAWASYDFEAVSVETELVWLFM